MLSIPYRWFFYFYIEQAEVREETFFESTLPGALKAKSNSNSLFPPLAAVVAVAGHSIARPIALRATGSHPSGRSSEKLPDGRLDKHFN